jgi:membrane associated rhomboid family serine protease
MNRASAIQLPPAVLWLSLAFIALHIVRQFLSEHADRWLLLALAFIPARYGEVAEVLPGGIAALYWSPVSYAFLHADFVHLIVNIVWMASFGGALARRFGSGRFLLLAIACAAAGAGLHYLLNVDDTALVIGASGAVSGMMAATARFAFSPGGPLAGGAPTESYDAPAESLTAILKNRRAMAFLLIWFGVNLVFGLAGGLVPGVSGAIAWQAHVGGFLAGLLLFSLFDPIARVPKDIGPLES